MTEAQRRAMTELWPRFGVELTSGALDFANIFGRQAPVRAEIGFGNGESLLALAERNPDVNFLGIEVHRPGIGRLLQELAARDISNVRVICADAKIVLEHAIPPDSLDAIYLFFPDPWPKKRHHKRRLVQPDFTVLVTTRLRVGGCLHFATDWEDYASHALVALTATPGLRNASGDGKFRARPEERPLTKFERRGQRLGHGVWDIVFCRQ